MATQLPDLIDKPLSWTFGVLSYGRSLGHSLFVAALLSICVLAIAKKVGSESAAGAFALGYITHLFGDMLYPVLAGEWDVLRFLVWPLLPIEESDAGRSILGYFMQLEPTPTVLFEIGLFIMALTVWQLQQRPGTAYLQQRVSKFVDTSA